MNYIKCSKFEDLDDFRDSLLRGREIVFEYNGKKEKNSISIEIEPIVSKYLWNKVNLKK